MKYGPETPTVKAFIRHLKGMTKEQRAVVIITWYAASDATLGAALDAAFYAARDALAPTVLYAARDAARDAASDAAVCNAAVYAIYEIFGAAIMRERNQPFYFLPMFGFESPEAVLENDQ